MRGFFGEGQREDRVRAGETDAHQICDAMRQHARLARARTRDAHERAFGQFDRLPLRGVEGGENVGERSNEDHLPCEIWFCKFCINQIVELLEIANVEEMCVPGNQKCLTCLSDRIIIARKASLLCSRQRRLP